MANYILLYRGPATPIEDMTPEQNDAQMAAWNAWMAKVGDALTDLGKPFGARSAVDGEGATGPGSDLNGYTLVTADSLDAARALCDGHPFLADGGSQFCVEIYELVDIPM
jgi:YCII-related domain